MKILNNEEQSVVLKIAIKLHAPPKAIETIIYNTAEPCFVSPDPLCYALRINDMELFVYLMETFECLEKYKDPCSSHMTTYVNV